MMLNSSTRPFHDAILDPEIAAKRRKVADESMEDLYHDFDAVMDDYEEEDYEGEDYEEEDYEDEERDCTEEDYEDDDEGDDEDADQDDDNEQDEESGRQS